jgi:hypothetical protein
MKMQCMFRYLVVCIAMLFFCYSSAKKDDESISSKVSKSVTKRVSKTLNKKAKQIGSSIFGDDEDDDDEDDDEDEDDEEDEEDTVTRKSSKKAKKAKKIQPGGPGEQKVPNYIRGGSFWRSAKGEE